MHDDDKFLRNSMLSRKQSESRKRPVVDRVWKVLQLHTAAGVMRALSRSYATARYSTVE